MGRFNPTTAPAVARVTSGGASAVESPPQLAVLPPPTPITEAPVPAAKPKPKLNFGGLAKKETSPLTSDYPVLPDPDGMMAAQAAAFLDAQAAEEAATGAKEAARFELVKAVAPFHFRINAGHSEVPSTVSVQSPKGEVRVTFKDAYKKLTEAKLSDVTQIIGQELADTYMRQTFEFSIKSEKIPEDKMQDVIDAIGEMASTLGIVDAVTVDTCYKPTAEWHTARFRLLNADQNMRLEGAVDREKGFCQIAVGAARGGKK